MYENLIYESRESIAIVTINRPSVRNALNSATVRELAAAFDQAVLDEEFDFFVKTKRARVSQFAFPGLRGNLDAEKLREAALAVRTGAGYFQPVVRENRHQRFADL